MDKYRICIISPPGYKHTHCFLELALLLKSSFDSLQISCDTSVNELSPDRVNILLGGNLIQNFPPLRSFRYIPYQLEQLCNNPNLRGEYIDEYLANAAEVWDYSQENITFLYNRGIHSRYVPVGYHQALELIPQNVTKEYDVLFYGSIGPRRSEILKKLEKEGVKVKTVFGIYGPERDQIIARSRIVLNIHFYSAKIFEAVRVSYLLNNRCFTLSEESAFNPYPEVDLCFTPYEKLVETCLKVLENDSLCEDNALRCYEQFRDNYPMTGILKQRLQL